MTRMDEWLSYKRWMSETVFKRYWRYACIPGVYGGVEDGELDEAGHTLVYNALKALLGACVHTW
jgi:hypothetical protein